MSYEPRLKTKYRETVRGNLMKTFSYKNVNQVPRITKIVINVGMGDGKDNPKAIEAAVDELQRITGRKPVIKKARNAISNFKLREGMPIGTTVTLRREWMWEFLDRFISMTAPRIRDFRGLSNKSFDGRGNYNLGLKEQVVFTEIEYDRVERVHGMDIAFVTDARTDEECYQLLKELGMPIVSKSKED